MKKFFMMLFLVGLLILSLTACAMANSIYIGGLIESKWEKTNTPTDNDLKGVVVTGDFTFGNDLTLWLEFTNRSKDTVNGDIDLDNHYIKFSCLDLMATDAATIEITAGYNKLCYNTINDPEYTGIIIGLDGKFKLGEKSQLSGAVGYSVSGKYKESGSADQDVTILLSNIKYSYFFAGNLGASLGYQFEQYKLDDNNQKTTFSGPSLGLTYQF